MISRRMQQHIKGKLNCAVREKNNLASSAIETALLDMQGKRTDRPLL